MTNPSAAVLFDLDGTLLDTLADLAASGNEVLVSHGHPPHPVDAYRGFIGDGMINLVRRIFPPDARPEEEAEAESILAQYRAAYGRHWQDTTEPFHGIPALLDALVAAGIPLGVVSNKAQDFTERCVETFLSKWPWKIIIGHREGIPPKPDPTGALEAAAALAVSPENCYFIGDSDVDMMTARAAGMRAIGVAWGFRPVAELQETGATTILKTPGQLLSVIGL
jgi:phosphoglycolate phosphatase